MNRRFREAITEERFIPDKASIKHDSTSHYKCCCFVHTQILTFFGVLHFIADSTPNIVAVTDNASQILAISNEDLRGIAYPVPQIWYCSMLKFFVTPVQCL